MSAVVVWPASRITGVAHSGGVALLECRAFVVTSEVVTTEMMTTEVMTTEVMTAEAMMPQTSTMLTPSSAKTGHVASLFLSLTGT